MTQYDWHTERDKAITAMQGETPNATTETQMRDHFKDRPTLTVTVLHEAATEKQAGKCRSAWAVALHRLNVLTSPNVVVDDQTERHTAETKARNLIRNTGHEIETATELYSIIFDRGGPLHPWRTDSALVETALEQWRQTQVIKDDPTQPLTS